MIKSVYDTKGLQAACEEYLDKLVKDKYSSESYKYNIFEVAMETLYGENIWEFVIGDLGDWVPVRGTRIQMSDKAAGW